MPGISTDFTLIPWLSLAGLYLLWGWVCLAFFVVEARADVALYRSQKQLWASSRGKPDTWEDYLQVGCPGQYIGVWLLVPTVLLLSIDALSGCSVDLEKCSVFGRAILGALSG